MVPRAGAIGGSLGWSFGPMLPPILAELGASARPRPGSRGRGARRCRAHERPCGLPNPAQIAAYIKRLRGRRGRCGKAPGNQQERVLVQWRWRKGPVLAVLALAYLLAGAAFAAETIAAIE